MTIRIKTGTPKTEREDITVLLPEVNTGPSPRGSSYYKTLLACPREWALTYLAEIRPEITGEALTYGLLWHLCLEKLYKNMLSKEGDPVACAYEPIDAIKSEAGYQQFYDMLSRMLDGYLEQFWEVDQLTWTILAIEETLIYEGEFTYSTRLDLVVHDENDNLLWLVEHKSAKMLNAHLLDSYQLDMQILGQIWLLQNCVDLSKYPRFGGTKVNIATKQATPQFTRLDIHPSKYHLQAFEKSLQAWNQARAFYKSQGYPMALGHCSGYARGYGRCIFYELCHGNPTVSAEHWINCPDEKLPFGYKRDR